MPPVLGQWLAPCRFAVRALRRRAPPSGLQDLWVAISHAPAQTERARSPSRLGCAAEILCALLHSPTFLPRQGSSKTALAAGHRPNWRVRPRGHDRSRRATSSRSLRGRGAPGRSGIPNRRRLLRIDLDSLTTRPHVLHESPVSPLGQSAMHGDAHAVRMLSAPPSLLGNHDARSLGYQIGSLNWDPAPTLIVQVAARYVDGVS